MGSPSRTPSRSRSFTQSFSVVTSALRRWTVQPIAADLRQRRCTDGDLKTTGSRDRLRPTGEADDPGATESRCPRTRKTASFGAVPSADGRPLRFPSVPHEHARHDRAGLPHGIFSRAVRGRPVAPGKSGRSASRQLPRPLRVRRGAPVTAREAARVQIRTARAR